MRVNHLYFKELNSVGKALWWGVVRKKNLGVKRAAWGTVEEKIGTLPHQGWSQAKVPKQNTAQSIIKLATNNRGFVMFRLSIILTNSKHMFEKDARKVNKGALLLGLPKSINILKPRVTFRFAYK